MSDPWQFWMMQLAGENPALPPMIRPERPEQGFFLLRQSQTTRVPPEKRTIGGPRHNRTTHHFPVAIWEDESGWHCIITRPGGVSHLTDPMTIDEEIFSRCCRAAIDHETYLAKVKELEADRERVSADQTIEHDDLDRSSQFG